ncbi:LysR family transcriptional regulator [Caballeronia sordidicola]|uniref:Putative transcription regulator protein of MDR efflux pump cluster n=1 Tax=Caballeronia sordidicola TaxID=196367 RepID=A0A226WSC4_CABSO|nr:LysR family transcriptional regulator [Caballeronia sordidicola]OXC73518.1 putative transcription regulator protein of MDR efflux pump cluster [Caballeronia sordidicola]
MIDRIMAMQTFVRIVDANSFTRAAQSLGIPRATATTLVQSLEAMLGVQLLARTTRRLNLTIEGTAYYERCVQILADIDDIEANLRHPDDRPRGRLRVEMPAVVANAILLPALDDFHARYEHIQLAFGVSNRQVDLVGEAIDCCVVIGQLPDSGLAARRLGTLERVTCASPLYLARYGAPQRFDELTDHVAVNCTCPQTGRPADFEFQVEGDMLNLPLEGFLQVSDEHAYLDCGLRGLGLIQPPLALAQPYLDSGRLREVLPHCRPAPLAISIAYLRHRRAPSRVVAFVNWLSELFETGRHASHERPQVREILRGLEANEPA